MDNRVIEYIRQHNLPLQPQFTGEDTSTVAKAAAVLGIEEGQIAKSLAIRLPSQLSATEVGILVTMGTARLDNQKFKAAFHIKAKMLSPQETLEATGFAVGGVCPFGLPQGIPVFLDTSLQQYDTVYPAAGTSDSAIPVPVTHFAQYTGGSWVDVCKINSN